MNDLKFAELTDQLIVVNSNAVVLEAEMIARFGKDIRPYVQRLEDLSFQSMQLSFDRLELLKEPVEKKLFFNRLFKK